MKIAILGTRGVPPSYGGFETFAAELGVRLTARGHDVFVYCREASWKLAVDDWQEAAPHSGGRASSPASRRRSTGYSTWRGIHRVVLPALRHKYFETVSHTFLSALDALRRDFDAVLVCNAANAFVLPLLKAARIPVVINVDGIERRRRKWNILGRAVYATGETFSVGFANRVVADADVIARYYRERYALDPVTIRYGAEFPIEEDSDVLARLGLRPREYLLYVSRFEPENNPLEVVEAYEKLAVNGWGLAVESAEPAEPPSTANRRPPTASRPPLVMLGKGLYAPSLVSALHDHASDHVLLPGALYGHDYRTLQRNALIYIQATEVGGTHPALIEAMASGGCVLAHDTPENREVGGDAVGYFSLRPEETLSGMIREWLANPLIRQGFCARARKRAEQRYSWERVTDQYERLLETVAGV